MTQISQKNESLSIAKIFICVNLRTLWTKILLTSCPEVEKISGAIRNPQLIQTK